MVNTQQKRALGILSGHENTEGSLKALHSSGFSMDKISVVGRDLNPEAETPGNVEISNQVGDTKVDATQSTVSNTATVSATGFTMLGLTSLALPGLGVVLAAGSFAAALAATVASTGVAAVAANNLVKALSQMGIPDAQAKLYSDQLHQGNYLVMVEGSEEEIQQAESIFHDYKVTDWNVY
jgi:hypothetical protein